MNIEDIAKICHEMNRVYCSTIVDHRQVEWDKAPEWERIRAVRVVEFLRDSPLAVASASHYSWLNEMWRDGWTFGRVVDLENKKHPGFILYEELPVEEQAKGRLFTSLVRALLPFLSTDEEDLESQRIAREARLRELGFEEPSAEQKREWSRW